MSTASLHLQNYSAAEHHYSTALDAAGASTTLRCTLLTNRAVARHRLGRYSMAAEDAEAALAAGAPAAKPTFVAAASKLMLGEGSAAARHASALLSILDLGKAAADGAAAARPGGWVELHHHAAALSAHQQRLTGLQGQPPDPSAGSLLGQLLAALEAEAAGEGEGKAGPAELLLQLAALLGGPGGVAAWDEVATAAAELEARHGHTLVLFYLADPDPACQRAATAALQAAAQAAAGGRASVVLWPPAVWQRLVALAVDAGGAGAAPAMQLLSWAAGRDP